MGTSAGALGGGAETVRGAGDGSQPLNYSETTDDQILELEEAPDVTPLEEESDSAAAELETDEAAGGEETVEEGELPAGKLEVAGGDFKLSPKLAAHLDQISKSDPAGAKEIRNALFREGAFRQIWPTLAEARTVRELFPGGAEEAQTAVRAREDLAEFDHLFYSEDPNDQATFITRMRDESPEAFKRFAQSFPQTLHQLDPETFTAIQKGSWQDTLANLWEAAEGQGLGEGKPGQNQRNAVDVISMMLFGKRFEQMKRERSDPKSEALTAREKRLKDEEGRFENQKWNDFRGNIQQDAIPGQISKIEAMVKPLLDKTAAKGNTKVLKRIVGEVYQIIDQRMTDNREYVRSLSRTFRDGDRSPAHRAKVLAKIDAGWSPLRKSTVQQVVNEWTQTVLGTSAARQTTQRTAAARRDISGGTPERGAGGAARPVPARSVNPSTVNYNATSDDDIMDGRVRLKK